MGHLTNVLVTGTELLPIMPVKRTATYASALVAAVENLEVTQGEEDTSGGLEEPIAQSDDVEAIMTLNVLLTGQLDYNQTALMKIRIDDGVALTVPKFSDLTTWLVGKNRLKTIKPAEHAHYVQGFIKDLLSAPDFGAEEFASLRHYTIFKSANKILGRINDGRSRRNFWEVLIEMTTPTTFQLQKDQKVLTIKLDTNIATKLGILREYNSDIPSKEEVESMCESLYASTEDCKRFAKLLKTVLVGARESLHELIRFKSSKSEYKDTGLSTSARGKTPEEKAMFDTGLAKTVTPPARSLRPVPFDS